MVRPSTINSIKIINIGKDKDEERNVTTGKVDKIEKRRQFDGNYVWAHTEKNVYIKMLIEKLE